MVPRCRGGGGGVCVGGALVGAEGRGGGGVCVSRYVFELQ